MIWQKNPLTVQGTLDRCWLFTYHTPVEQARKLLPWPLEPITHEGYAFWNIVVCHISSMRPAHFPTCIGMNYWHLAYRLYVRLPLKQRPPIEGLYFLRSDCDLPFMTRLGNGLTDFHFHTAPLFVRQEQEILEIQLESRDAPAYARLQPTTAPQYSAHSAFPSLEKAAAVLKYKPYGISIDGSGRANVVSITRNEQAWKSHLVQVETAEWSFLHSQDVVPEICYEVEPIVYQWNRGRSYDLTAR